MKKQIHKVLNYVHHATDKVWILRVIRWFVWVFLLGRLRYIRSEEYKEHLRDIWWTVKMKTVILAIILFFVLLYHRAEVISGVKEVINNYNFKS